MKKRFLLIAALCILVPSMAYSVGEGVREWVWGLGYYVWGDMTVTGNVVSDGTVTADSFDSGPSATGGKITIKECEVAGGATCPEIGYADSLTIAMPDGVNPLGADKTHYGYRRVSFNVYHANIAASDGKCFISGNNGAGGFQVCGSVFDAGNVYRTSVSTARLYQHSIYVHDCYSAPQEEFNVFDDNADEAVLTLRAYSLDDDDGASVAQDFAEVFTIKDDSQSCGADTNCIGDSGDYGFIVWQVREAIEIDAGVDTTGMLLELKFNWTAGGGADEDLYYAVECETM